MCAEGYLFGFERRGYLKAGAFVPEVVIEHPDLLRQQYEEFVHAGSDVVLAFTVSLFFSVAKKGDRCLLFLRLTPGKIEKAYSSHTTSMKFIR